MQETFAQLGMNYSMGGKTGSTLNSHRLIWWALQKGGPAAQDRVVEALFKAYFTEVCSGATQMRAPVGKL